MKYFLPGIILIIFSWIFAWTQFSSLSVYYFLPLWLGYILVANGMSEIVLKDSLIKRMGWWFLLLFVFSIPLWWFFEYLNLFVHNWNYLIPLEWSPNVVLLMKTISFATVIPAVCSVGFLFGQLFKRSSRFHFRAMNVSSRVLVTLIVIGVVFFALVINYPTVFFPLIWLAPLFILDPLNFRLGFRSILGCLRAGEGNLIAAFVLGTLLTGFFWEMWNFYAFPKWVYTIPYADFGKVFEMPILGYFGYIPFGLFVLSFTFLCLGLVEQWTKTPLQKYLT